AVPGSARPRGRLVRQLGQGVDHPVDALTRKQRTFTMSSLAQTDTRPREGLLDRMGIPSSLALGFLAVLIFMTGNGVESNFITPHMVAVLGSPEATVATIVSMYSLTVLIGS